MTAPATPDEQATPSTAEAFAEAIATAALGVAGRFATGATLWAIAPGLDDHARHVAVEFLHPVVVGTRALPAIALTGADLVDSARRACQLGDVAVLIGPATAELAARCRAWGVTTVALMWDDAKVARHANHVVRLSGEPDAIRAYHLLWEMTQVCLEHPDVLEQGGTTATCAVCADDAEVGEVTAVLDDEVELRTPRGLLRAAATLLPDLSIGDLVLAHAGIVIGREQAA